MLPSLIERCPYIEVPLYLHTYGAASYSIVPLAPCDGTASLLDTVSLLSHCIIYYVIDY